MDIFYEKLSKKIKSIRARLGLSQEALAKELGISRVAVSQIESGDRKISEYSHNDVPWLTAEEGAVIDYESVFYRTPPYSVRDYGDENI